MIAVVASMVVVAAETPVEALGAAVEFVSMEMLSSVTVVSLGSPPSVKRRPVGRENKPLFAHADTLVMREASHAPRHDMMRRRLLVNDGMSVVAAACGTVAAEPLVEVFGASTTVELLGPAPNVKREPAEEENELLLTHNVLRGR